MENKINIAEILKNCEKGMELYSPLFGDCTFVKVHDYEDQIIVKLETGATVSFQNDGRYYDYPNAECILFPKGKTTWEGFVLPCKFKDGDIISNGRYIAIFHKIDNIENCVNPNVIYYHCWYNKNTYHKFKAKIDFGIGTFEKYKYATEEEKAKLFQAIKNNGYNWNAETKTLEKLTPNKFDITTLKPFDRVLVRDTNEDYWKISMFGYIGTYDRQYFMCIANSGFYQCIPYEKNEHLLGTTDDCDEFYKTWG